MHIHILGICGTFMGGLALLAREQGWRVTGCDHNVYPPMSTQLEEQGIVLTQGYAVHTLPKHADCYIIGNAMSRGNPYVEYILDHKLPYDSGPRFLAQHVLHKKTVLAVAGTHGKTTTASLLTWIFEQQGIDVGFLIGGVPKNFKVSSRLGKSPYFVIEADEYDTAFFDKRSKFIHYAPNTLILNNLEYDHADIFESVEAIKKQFHHLLRTVPSNGHILAATDEPHLDAVLDMGCWTPRQRFGINTPADWQASILDHAGQHFEVIYQGQQQGEVCWSLTGKHNVKNALAAIAAAYHNGIAIRDAMAAVSSFKGVKRRMEVLYQNKGLTLYDDFAHHPTAIKTTLQGLRGAVGRQKIVVLMELRSNSLRQGVHLDTLPLSFVDADEVFLLQPATVPINMQSIAEAITPASAQVYTDVESMVEALIRLPYIEKHIIIMSNGGFDGLREKLLKKLNEATS